VSTGPSTSWAIRKAFDRLAHGTGDALSVEAARRLLDHAAAIEFKPERIADIGSGSGAVEGDLKTRFPRSTILSVDHSWRQLSRHTGACRIQADACYLPLKENGADLAFSNLLLPWIARPKLWLGEIQRIVRTGGLLLFSSLGPSSLSELRQIWLKQGVELPNPLIDLQALGNLLLESGFRDPVLETDRLSVRYRDIDTMFEELKSAGAGVWLSHRCHGLAGKERFLSFRRACEASMRAGRFELSLELICGHAWIAPKTRLRSGPGEDGAMPLHYLPC